MNYKKSLNNYIIILIAVLILLTGFLFLTQSRIDTKGLSNSFFHENSTKNINNQFFTIIVLFFMGFFVLLPFESKIEINYIMILSFVIGFFIFCFISMFLLLTRINLNKPSIFIIYCTVLLIIYIKSYIINKQTHNPTKQKFFCMLFWLIIILAFGYVFSRLNYSILTFDSVQYKNLGNSYGKFQNITTYAYYALVGHPFIPTLLNTITVLAGFDFAYGIQNLFMFNCVVLFGYLTYDYTKSFDFKHPLLISLIPTALLATSFFVVFLSICHVPNMYAGYFLLFFILYLEKFNRYAKLQDIVFAFIFALAFCFSRIEGPLITAFIMAYLAHNKLSTKIVISFTSILTVIISLYYILILSFVGTSYESAFLTLDKCVLVILIMLVIIVYTKLKDKYFMNKNDLLLKIYLFSVLLFSVILCLMDIPKTIHNISSLYINIFAEGMWIISWFVVILFACICLVLNENESCKKGLSQDIIYLYIVLLFAIFAFRTDNLHINWSDSGNRLLMHIYPVIIYSIYNNIINYCKNDKYIEY